MDFFSNFYSGFLNTRTEIILVIVVAATLVVSLTLIFVVRDVREKRRRRRAAQEAFEKIAREKGLAPSERRAVETLAGHVSSPEARHLVVRSQGMYNAAAARALQKSELPEQELSALRVKLGFAGKRTDKPPASTTELPIGAGVVVREKGKPPVRARVSDQKAEYLELKLDLGTRRFTFGSPVAVVHQSNAGIFAFETVVEAEKNRILRLGHSERPKRIQRRKHYRKDLVLPVYVKRMGADTTATESRFLDLGGGGASLENPGKGFGTGADLELTFHPDSDGRLNLPAHVVRTSASGRVLHVQFPRLRESTRDRIYRLLFHASR